MNWKMRGIKSEGLQSPRRQQKPLCPAGKDRCKGPGPREPGSPGAREAAAAAAAAAAVAALVFSGPRRDAVTQPSEIWARAAQPTTGQQPSASAFRLSPPRWLRPWPGPSRPASVQAPGPRAWGVARRSMAKSSSLRSPFRPQLKSHFLTNDSPIQRSKGAKVLYFTVWHTEDFRGVSRGTESGSRYLELTYAMHFVMKHQ
ncbi:uncharacterized protein [Gorilla gorilla gorilla]|uniref:uncharacterized protein n=1 Tax=Gorilla gorilla gorilla TaxID=9595 RepID=UPI003008B194